MKLRFIYCRSLCNVEYTLRAYFWMQICWSYLLIIATNRCNHTEWREQLITRTNWLSNSHFLFGSFFLFMQIKFYQTMWHVCIPHGDEPQKNLKIASCTKQIHLCCYSQKKTFLSFQEDSHKVGVMKLSQFDYTRKRCQATTWFALKLYIKTAKRVNFAFLLTINVI